jgi:hypothetical protein
MDALSDKRELSVFLFDRGLFYVPSGTPNGVFHPPCLLYHSGFALSRPEKEKVFGNVYFIYHFEESGQIQVFWIMIPFEETVFSEEEEIWIKNWMEKSERLKIMRDRHIDFFRRLRPWLDGAIKPVWKDWTIDGQYCSTELSIGGNPFRLDIQLDENGKVKDIFLSDIDLDADYFNAFRIFSIIALHFNDLLVEWMEEIRQVLEKRRIERFQMEMSYPGFNFI